MVPSCAPLKRQLAWVQVFSSHFNAFPLSKFPNFPIEFLWEIQNLSVVTKGYCSIMMKVCYLSFCLHFSAGCWSLELALRTSEREVNLCHAGRDGSIWHQVAEILLLVTGSSELLNHEAWLISVPLPACQQLPNNSFLCAA